MFSAARGSGAAIARSRSLAEMATDLAERCTDRHARIFAALGTGVAAFSEYRWRECRPHFARVKELDAVGGAHATWERGTADFHMMHLLALYTETSIHLYEGDAVGAYRLIAKGWPRLVASHLFQVRALEIHTRELRARTLLAQQRHEPAGRKALLAAVDADVRWLSRQERALPHAYAAVLEAGLAEARGRNPEPSLARAERLFVEAGMDLWAASVQRRRGEVGEPGLIAVADPALTRLGVRDPERAVAMMFGRGAERS